MTTKGYMPLNMEESENKQLLTAESVETPPCCNSTRFTLVTLIGLVVLLTGALFCVTKFPAPDQPCHNQDRKGLNTESGELLLGIMADVHLGMHMEECLGRGASVYGRFGCDATPGLLNASLASLSSHLNGSADGPLIMLGDAALHQNEESWDYKKTLESMRYLSEQFQSFFPMTSVFSVIGNNDLPAHNTVPDIGWYTTVLQIFEPGITRDPRVSVPANFQEIFMYGGYYSAKFDNKFTVIAMNTNLFSANVKDLTVQAGYAKSHLEWLNETLVSVENRALIIGHIPPVLSLYSLHHKQAAKTMWRLQYIEQFQKIFVEHHEKIMGTMFGHEHQDTFVVEEVQDVKMGMFMFPALSPIYDGQPSYGVMALHNSEETDVMTIRNIFTFHTWLDYYTAIKKEPQFNTYRSFGDILNLKELTYDGLKNSTKNIIKESDGFKTFNGLKEKIYQERTVPIMNPHTFYCYTTNIKIAEFIKCIEHFGFDGKPYIVNSE